MLDSVTDADLVRCAKAGELEAFELLASRYERRVYWLARRIPRQEQDAEDVTQQTFLSALEHLDMKCEELLAMLNDYVDGEVDPGVCDELKQHLEGCNPCQVVVDNIRKTITLYKEGRQYDLPLVFRERLHSILRAKWREKHREI